MFLLDRRAGGVQAVVRFACLREAKKLRGIAPSVGTIAFNRTDVGFVPPARPYGASLHAVCAPLVPSLERPIDTIDAQWHALLACNGKAPTISGAFNHVVLPIGGNQYFASTGPQLNRKKQSLNL
jgi:hypothetical protein